MVNELRDLLREQVATPPHDDADLGAVLRTGRRRVRRRRRALVGGALGTAALVATTAVVLPRMTPPDFAAAGVPRPDAPTLHLADAERAVEGRDYRVLASYTNDNLDRDNGQYLDGVTDDGLVLFRDGPRADQLEPRLALMDPATGEKDWLPALPVDGLGTQTWPLALGTDRLVLLGIEGAGMKVDLVAHVFDRRAREWRTVAWPGLPKVEEPRAELGPDGRLYVTVPAVPGKPPEGGWPMGPDGEADDADAPGETHRLWSASLTDPADVRDEGLTVGDVAFTESSMVWTDSTNGESGQVHVRDLASGDEHSFDPGSGERCNLLTFGATDDHVVMGQYCGTYDDGVRDDRVQVVSTDGEQVVTIQGSSIDGDLGSAVGEGLVSVTSREPGGTGTYVYDLGSERFLRLSEDVAQWSVGGGPTLEGQLMWTTPVNRKRGATQWLAEVVD